MERRLARNPCGSRHTIFWSPEPAVGSLPYCAHVFIAAVMAKALHSCAAGILAAPELLRARSVARRGNCILDGNDCIVDQPRLAPKPAMSAGQTGILGRPAYLMRSGTAPMRVWPLATPGAFAKDLYAGRRQKPRRGHQVECSASCRSRAWWGGPRFAHGPPDFLPRPQATRAAPGGFRLSAN